MDSIKKSQFHLLLCEFMYLYIIAILFNALVWWTRLFWFILQAIWFFNFCQCNWSNSVHLKDKDPTYKILSIPKTHLPPLFAKYMILWHHLWDKGYEMHSIDSIHWQQNQCRCKILSTWNIFNCSLFSFNIYSYLMLWHKKRCSWFENWWMGFCQYMFFILRVL